MDAEQLLEELRRTAVPVDEVLAPATSGVYAWFLDEPGAIPSLPIQGIEPIYIGISSNLARRSNENHFKTGGSGFSTLRRSVGALLKQELALTAQPRSLGPSVQNYRCYSFDDQGERRLTEWMKTHLRVAASEHPNPESVELALIRIAGPPLNLTGWTNPHAAKLKALRKCCADEARAHAG